MAGSVIELTDATFDNIVHNSDVPVLVDFYTEYCQPCKMIAPIIEEIADEYLGRVKICKINAEENHDSAIEYSITGVPTIFLFKDGHPQKQLRGWTNKKDLTEAIEELL